MRRNEKILSFEAHREFLGKLFKKIVAWVLVFTFSYSQIVWAIDVRQMLLDAKASFELDDAEGPIGMGSAELTSAESQQQAVVDQQQALQDLQNLNFSLTTQNGDILKYVGDKLSQVNRPDGTVLKDIVLDPDGSIQNADLKLSDGSIQVYQNGQVLGYLQPNGTSVEYDVSTGKVIKTISPEGVISNYTYTPDSKTVVSTVNGPTVTYDTQDVIEKIEQPDGTVVEFNQGKISKVLKDDYEYLYKEEALPDNNIKLTIQDGGGTEPTESILSISTLDTSGRSLHRKTDGTYEAGWKLGSDSSLYTYWGNQWVEYQIGVEQAGDLKIGLEAVNNGSKGIPSSYTHFQLELFIDGVSQGYYYAPAHSTLWQSGSFTLQGLTEGSHTIQMIWVNSNAGVSGYDANFQFRNLKMTAISQTAPTPTRPPLDGYPSWVIYDPSGNMLEGMLPDSTHLTFTDGLLTGAVDKDGNATSFSFEESALFNVTQSTISQNSLDSTYSAEGKLSSVKLGDLTIHYKKGETTIDSIEKSDGTEIFNITFDANGSIQDATVATPDGEERVYVSGKLESMTRPDYTKLFYVDEKLLKIITPEALTYDFSYTSPDVIEAALNSPEIPDALTPIRMQYDTSFNLKKVIRQNQEIINYAGSDVQMIETPNDAPQVFSYQKDTQGIVTSYTVTQGNVETFYDANNNPIQAAISPTPANPHTLEVIYQYGKIRSINKDGVLTFKYTYTFDTNGEEITNIEDLEEKSLKVYKSGNLLTSLNQDTSVLSTYFYESVILSISEGSQEGDSSASPQNDVRVKQVQVTRLGRTLHTYSYSYEGDQTLVTDEEGVKRTYGSDKKLSFLEKESQKFSYAYYTGLNNEAITEERLIEKKLSDGSVVHYESGQVTSIDLTDGSSITDIVLDGGRNVVKAAKSFSDGSKKVFSETSILEEITPEGAHFYYENGILSKVTDSQVRDFVYSYDRDPSGNLTATWVKKDAADLKYSATGSLLGLKAEGVLTPEEVIAQAQHFYEGGSGGPYSHDGDFNTAQVASGSRSFDRTQGSISFYLTSTHTFPVPQTITGIQYRFYTYGAGWGDYSNNNHASGNYSVEYRQGTSDWIPFQNAQGGMGDTGQVTKALNVSGITAIRATASGYGEGSDHGGAVASAYIYELQYGLADLSFFNYSDGSFTNQAGQTTSVSGYSLTTPYMDKLNTPNPPSFDTWLQSTKDAVLDAQSVVSQEYSKDGTLESQSKADQTVTLFENNKPSKVLDENGLLLIEYAYDADGHPSRVYLKNARDTLPDEVLKAKQHIEEERAKSLQLLAAQKNLAYQSIQNQADAQRLILQSQLGILEGQYSGLSNSQARGKAAKSAKAEALGNLSASMNQIYSALTSVASSEADAYASLDSQVKTVSDQIETDAQKAYEELDKQETNLKKEILRQEISPIVYDYYRRILGRDPSNTEYDFWISKVDYDSGDTFSEAQVWYDRFEKQETILPISIYGASYIVYQAYGWARVTQENALQTHGKEDRKVEYQVSLAQAGDLRLDFEAINFNTPIYEGFNYQFDLFVDGVKTGYAEVAGSKTVWSQGAFLFDGLSAGTHTIGFKWLNDEAKKNSSGDWIYDANLKIRNFKITHLVDVPVLGLTPLTEALKLHVHALPELKERSDYVTAIKEGVTNQINGYLAKSESDKYTFAAALGLGPDEIIALSGSDAQKILSWLDSRTLHFGQSAFLALESLLDQKGITYTRTDIAQKAILIDVLTGVISPLDDGDLVLSMFALNKVAGLYGLSLSGANLAWEDLSVILSASEGSRLIAHINGNHYVVITGITQDTITYIDPGIGADKQNESLTVTKDGFMKVWKGNVTASAVILSERQRAEGSQVKILSASQTQSIRGAFWGSLLNILAFVVWIINPALGLLINGLRIAALVASIIEKDWLSAATAVVSLAFGDFGKGLGEIFKGAGPVGQALNSVGQFFGSVFQTVQGFFGHIGTFFHGISNAITTSEIGSRLIETAVGIGVNYGISRGLETVGVSPQIAGFFGSLAAGAIVGGMKPTDSAKGIDQAINIQKSINETVTISEVGRLGLELGLDSSFVQIATLALASIQGIKIQNPTLPIEKAFDQVKSQLFSSLAQYGVEKLSTSLGLDPRISTLIGAPISGAIGAGLTGGANVGKNIIDAINTGFTQSIVKYGIDFIGTQNPILGSLLGGAVAKNIALAIGRDGLFNGIFNIFGKTVSNLFNVVGGVARSVGGGITTFGDALANKGPVGALESFLGSIFGAAATQPVYQAGSVDEFLQNSTSYSYTMPSGTQVNEYFLTGDDSIFFGTDGSFAGLKRDDIYEFGMFELTDNEILRLWEGDIYADIQDGLQLYAQVEKGELIHFDVRDGDDVLLQADPEKQDKPIYIEAPKPDDPDSSFNFWGAVFNIVPMALTFFINEGVADAAEMAVSGSIEAVRNIHYIFGNGFNNTIVPEHTKDQLIQPYINLLAFKDKVINIFQSINVPMFETTNLFGNAVDWFQDFGQDLAEENKFLQFLNSLDSVDDFFVKLAKNLIPSADIPSFLQPLVTKIQNWYNRIFGGVANGFNNDLVNEVIQKITAFTSAQGPIKDAIAFAHSGFFAPLIGAIEKAQYDIRTVINYEGPFILGDGYYINNPNLKRIINVWGTAPNIAMTGQYTGVPPNGKNSVTIDLSKKAVPVGDFGPPFLAQPAHFGGPNFLETVNIKILGARHNDFSYREYDDKGNELWNRNPYEPERIAREINFKTNKFMRNLYRATKDEETHPGALREFLENTAGVSENATTGIWTVDARHLPYELEYSYI